MMIGRHDDSARRAAATLLGAAVVALATVAGAQASVRTTLPEPVRNVRVVLTDQGVKLNILKIARGSLVEFRVTNKSSDARDFFVSGYIVRALKPGRTRGFALQFLYRGKYSYYSAAHPGKKFTGIFKVT